MNIDFLPTLDINNIDFSVITDTGFWFGLAVGLSVELETLCRFIVKMINNYIPNKPLPVRMYFLKAINQISKGFDKAIPDKQIESEIKNYELGTSKK